MQDNAKDVYVGIGSNLDDPIDQVSKAIEKIDQHTECTVSKRSSLYRTAPIGFVDQPDFVNAVCKLSTGLCPIELLRELLKLEMTLGKVRPDQVNGPRSIDLDLLLYENESINSPELELPHPRMHERGFVLQPLIEIEPALVIPNHGKAVDLLALCSDQQVEKL